MVGQKFNLPLEWLKKHIATLTLASRNLKRNLLMKLKCDDDVIITKIDLKFQSWRLIEWPNFQNMKITTVNFILKIKTQSEHLLLLPPRKTIHQKISLLHYGNLGNAYRDILFQEQAQNHWKLTPICFSFAAESSIFPPKGSSQMTHE